METSQRLQVGLPVEGLYRQGGRLPFIFWCPGVGSICCTYRLITLVLAINHSQSLNHICATVYLLNFVIPPFFSDSFVER